VTEAEFIAALRPLATDAGARGLLDDTAVLPMASTNLMLTHDMIVEGVHYLPTDPPGDVAWKLLAVNLSDLAAKGATPLGVLLGYALTGDGDWDAAFVAGLGEALAHFAVPLLGGDTVTAPTRVLGLTAIGHAVVAPPRSGAREGDVLYVTGTIGRAGLGLRGQGGPDALAAYRRPMPRLAEGIALAPVVHAMMDVSDGLLLDARRMAEASGLALTIDLARVPVAGDPIAAVTAGDDYELLFAAPADTLLPAGDVAVTAIGAFSAGGGLQLFDGDRRIALPTRLGYEHSSTGATNASE
jgi:thiamine-monophosphate kinase